MDSFDWTCPYCNRAQAVTLGQWTGENHQIYNDESEFGPIAGRIESIRCANKACRKLQLSFSLHHSKPDVRGVGRTIGNEIRRWQLLPDSLAKPQPEYIPKPLVDDYSEACRIRDLSPKASATLSRRCLQGMIRDFCEIHERTLYKEIETLREQLEKGEGVRHVHHDSVDAIHHVREIGNIGAHMQADVNHIIDVEPDEAQVLIGLIELLFDEWYVQRETRRQRLEELRNIATVKEEQKKEGGK